MDAQQILDIPIPCNRTRHFAERAEQRKLKPDVEKFVALLGTRFPASHGCSYVMIVRQNLPPELRKHPIVERAKGWLMIVGRNNTLVTCIHDEIECKKIRRAA